MMQPVRFFMVMSNSYLHHPNAWVRPSLKTTAGEAHSSLHLSCVGATVGAPRGRVTRVGYWAGWLGNFLSCSITWSRL
jgi:hypothetical protein